MSWHTVWVNIFYSGLFILFVSLTIAMLGKDKWDNAPLCIVMPLAVLLIGSVTSIAVSILGMIWTG